MFKRFLINTAIFYCFLFSSDFEILLENSRQIIFENENSQLSFDFFFEDKSNNYISQSDSCLLIINPFKQKFQIEIFNSIIYFDESIFLQFDYINQKLFKYDKDPILFNLIQSDLLNEDHYNFKSYKYNEKSKSYQKKYKNGKLKFEYSNSNWNLIFNDNSREVRLKNISFNKSNEELFFNIQKDSILINKKNNFYNFGSQ